LRWLFLPAAPDTFRSEERTILVREGMSITICDVGPRDAPVAG